MRGWPGPAQHLHLGFVLPSIRAAAVDDVQNAGAVDDRLQQLALVVKALIGSVRLHELAHDGRARARAAVVRSSQVSVSRARWKPGVSMSS